MRLHDLRQMGITSEVEEYRITKSNQASAMEQASRPHFLQQGTFFLTLTNFVRIVEVNTRE